MTKIGNGSIPLRIGNLINTKVYGGPIVKCPEDMFGVKMAVEIDCPHNVSVPTIDYSVPNVNELRVGVIKALMAMINGRLVYAGCYGGIGRTGLFLAALAKVQIEYRKIKHRPGRGKDPVLYVREHFISHAIETNQQEQYIADFDVAGIVTWLCYTQAAMGLGGFTPATETGRISAVEPSESNVPKDENCVTTPDGSCVAEDPCMHTTITDLARGVVGLGNQTPIEPIYDAHEVIPPDYLDGPVDLRHDTHRAQWKERYRERVSQFADELPETDSGDPENLQSQIWRLEGKLESQRLAMIDVKEIMQMMTQDTKSVAEQVGDLIKVMISERTYSLTKPKWYERLTTWVRNQIGSEPYGM